MNEPRHYLSVKDLDAMTAVCKICGPTDIHHFYSDKVQCSYMKERRLRLKRGNSSDTKTLHKLNNIDTSKWRANCSVCGEVEVHSRSLGLNGQQLWECHTVRVRHNQTLADKRVSTRSRTRRHGLTDKQAKKAKEGKVCFVCGTSENLTIDHSHVTNVLRGILCNTHNRALGMLGDGEDTQMIERLLLYIRNPPGVE